jgi:hypothetical protein
MTDGQEWAELWTKDGQEMYSGKYAWTQGESGQSYTCIYANEGALPDGSYKLQLFAGSDLPQLVESSITMGGGSGGTVPPPSSSGVTLFGTITDADTGYGISGVYVFILNSGITYDDWAGRNYTENDIFTWTKTDANGNYRMAVAINRNTPYTFVASIQGYYDQAGDNLVWSDTDPGEYEFNVSMSK